MASNTQNVVRYSALLAGLAYGFLHNRTVQKEGQEAAARREQLIADAKKAWIAKKNAPKTDLITDPEDPKFDLEKVIASWEKSA
ncbi:hypothetical protein CC85DRAFT_301720 [Cutaneotrichosporon oleaginosum]|uniref:ATP synthase F(0) complex subunit e, mitochondrial n=1 Tax=Cutaneotrichosporon oleaginosum TaxID=879819 RepID=A0A0J0XPX2_9TREE|nr:uncharacterized protein CC85DRAFT_301720 [Cutaneotrichosporon oleaginosum]KLT43127.1 hypothetical protein CC85DRAFT_301720 [Cutaneotrichosporon oleaginosum]TXT10054.1 hypothetical protein COLE_03988 [Cutaneotrichosporon oleaginosum]